MHKFSNIPIKERISNLQDRAMGSTQDEACGDRMARGRLKRKYGV